MMWSSNLLVLFVCAALCYADSAEDSVESASIELNESNFDEIVTGKTVLVLFERYVQYDFKRFLSIFFLIFDIWCVLH